MKFYIGAGFKNAELVRNLSKKLKAKGWIHTYNWAENIKENETVEDMMEFSKLEQKAIKDSDIIIIFMPAGRGTHIELGMAIAYNKKIYLCSKNKDDFDIRNTVNFYEMPNIEKIIGSEEDILAELFK